MVSASQHAKQVWEACGYSAKAFDILIDASHDLSSKAGFFVCLAACLTLLPGGLVLAGPPCSLFIWISCSVHRRHELPLGDTSRAKVRLANLIATNTAVILQQLIERQVNVMVEQPASSKMFELPAFQQLMDGGTWKIHSTYMGCFGHSMPKETILLSNMKSSRLLCRRMDWAWWRSHKSKMAPMPAAWVKTKDGRTKGTKALQGSAAYTKLFCNAVFEAWEKTMLH